jgi:hypothetical protein
MIGGVASRIIEATVRERTDPLKRNALILAAVTIALGMAAVFPVAAFAAGPKDTSGDQTASSRSGIGETWLARLDPGLQIPRDLAVKFGQAAVVQGLTKGQALAMLNDLRFAAAVGSPDQGYGLLEAMIANPGYIVKAYELLADRSYSSSGADSLQSAIMSVVPQLRNAYLKDLGLMAVKGSAGVLVLVDIETGLQYIGHGLLGTQLRAPGGGPLPSPSISPEEAAAQMWAQADAHAAATPSPEPGGLWKIQDHPDRDLLSAPGLYVGAALFLLAWVGWGAVALGRRLRPR